jgi:hypothetical protein
VTFEDSDSFSTFLGKNRTALDQNMYRVVQSGSVTVAGVLRAALGLS